MTLDCIKKVRASRVLVCGAKIFSSGLIFLAGLAEESGQDLAALPFSLSLVSLFNIYKFEYEYEQA
jgi:hypothetical protein